MVKGKFIENYGEHLRTMMLKHHMWEAVYVQTCSNAPMWDDCTTWPNGELVECYMESPKALNQIHIQQSKSISKGAKLGTKATRGTLFRMNHHLLNHPTHLPNFSVETTRSFATLAPSLELLCNSPQLPNQRPVAFRATSAWRSHVSNAPTSEGRDMASGNVMDMKWFTNSIWKTHILYMTHESHDKIPRQHMLTNIQVIQ